MQLNNETQFDKDNKQGDKGETIVYAWLLRNKNVRHVMDVSKDVRHQKNDIDFIVQLPTLQTKYIELKTDFQADTTGNVPYEMISNIDFNSKGCLEKTKSDFIFFYLYNSHDLLIAETPKLKQYVNENKQYLKLIPMGEKARGYLLNINDLIKRNIIKKYGGII